MKLPTKRAYISCVILLICGSIAFWLFPYNSQVGWYAIVLGIVFGLFPGPQLKARCEQNEQGSARFRHIVVTERKKSLNWWTSAFPWGLAVIGGVVFCLLSL